MLHIQINNYKRDLDIMSKSLFLFALNTMYAILALFPSATGTWRLPLTHIFNMKLMQQPV